MPLIIPGRDALAHVAAAQRTLGLTQEELGKMLGASRRTISRMVTGRSPLSIAHLHTLARAVHSKDPMLAAKLAAEGAETLEGLGIVRPAPPPAPLAPPAAPGRPFPATRLVVDSVVCAAAETMQAPPAAVREALRAAIARARALGLSLEDMDEGLAPPPPPPTG
jgi:transcriptional regulator with XRE-family HTH domain